MYSGHGIKQIICTLEHSISSELFNEIIGFKSFGSKKELDLNTETTDDVYCCGSILFEKNNYAKLLQPSLIC
jgi:hypothetical protein